MKSGFRAAAAVAVSALGCCRASAAPVYLPPGSNLTFGEITHTQRVLSSGNNPAAAAVFAADLEDGERGRGLAGSLSVGLEYGNFQELFDTIDELARRYRPTNPGEGGGGPGQKPDEKLPGGIEIGDIIDWAFPELRPALEAAALEIATQAALLGVISSEGYARAFASADLPIVIGHDILGGSLTVGYGISGTARTFGVADRDIEFDLEEALLDLAQQISDALDELLLGPVLFDVAGDADFTVDPGTNTLRFQLDNDSLLLSKSTQLNELSIGYSRSMASNARGALFMGARGRFYNMALSRLSVRFGDITDAEELFEAIRHADSNRDSGFGIDLGMLWRANRYQIGATLTNANEPTFRYPEVELAPYHNPQIIKALLDDESYTMERQLRLEAAIFTEGRNWGANFGIDANAVRDPVGEEFRWVTVSGEWNTNTSWVPNIRLGYRRNLVGTEVSYFSAGLQLFRFFNLDVASALDTVSINGDKLPRGLMLSMGFSFPF